jgi:hypothetical protein
MEKGWPVQVVAGQQKIMKLRKRLRKGLMVLMVKRKMCLMWKKINPPNYVGKGPLVFRAPTNLTWRVKVSYKGKTTSVREIGGSLLALNLKMPTIIDFTPFLARFL